MLTAFLDVVGSANFINEITKERSVTSRYHGSKIFWITTIRSLSNDDGNGNGNGNGKKAIGLMSKTTLLHVHHAFLYIS